MTFNAIIYRSKELYEITGALIPADKLCFGIGEYGYTPLKVGTELDFIFGRAYDFYPDGDKIQKFSDIIINQHPVILKRDTTGNFFISIKKFNGETEDKLVLSNLRCAALKQLVKDYKKEIGTQKGEEMGLDMFLWRAHKDTDTNSEEFSENSTEIAYWRKANQIHKWFVDNVQDGVDDGEVHEVPINKLLEFYDQLINARLTRNANLFPPMSGFFFGNTDINEYYWETLRDTIEMLAPEVQRIREMVQDGTIGSYTQKYYYYASW